MEYCVKALQLTGLQSLLSTWLVRQHVHCLLLSLHCIPGVWCLSLSTLCIVFALSLATRKHPSWKPYSSLGCSFLNGSLVGGRDTVIGLVNEDASLELRSVYKLKDPSTTGADKIDFGR